MRKLVFLLSLAALLTYCDDKQVSEFNAVQYVDPQIGSVHARWFFYTPAALPFGMAKLAPHTNAYESMGSWMPGGYDDRHNSIEGFGHFHEMWTPLNCRWSPPISTAAIVPRQPVQGTSMQTTK
jgi:putative alpha-1,2-mannosidase